MTKLQIQPATAASAPPATKQVIGSPQPCFANNPAV